VALRCELGALDLEDTAAYIVARIRTAGGNPANIFTEQAVRLIHQYSSGLPRTINVLCDNALLAGFAWDRRPIDANMVLDACRDFDLREPVEPEQVAAVPAPLTLVAANDSTPARHDSASEVDLCIEELLAQVQRMATDTLDGSGFDVRDRPSIVNGSGRRSAQ
jgi:hypothetical protein